MPNPNYMVDSFSLPSLRIESLFNGDSIATATGFIVKTNKSYFLVTNWHVVSGKHPDTNEFLDPYKRIPDTLGIWHHSSLSIYGYGVWTHRTETLWDANGTNRWLQHPNKTIRDREHPFERDIDVVALPLTNLEDVNLYPLDMSSALTDVYLPPGLPISIIGYPFGKTGASYFPIWKTGHIASDIFAHYSQRFFYVDATTRDGMSGSPVVFRDVQSHLNTTTGDDKIQTRFMGIYSGRIHKDSEIGIVWQPSLLEDILGSF